jgi:uncharacterized heparinase superfamily protein
LFAPRDGKIASADNALCLTFLGYAERLSVPELDFASPGLRPERQLWCMNLHYMEYLEEVQDDLFAALIEAWIKANPPGRRHAWKDSWNSYALSLRVVVWMQELMRRVSRLPADAVMRAETSLAAQLRYLERNLETDLGGNHLIKNIKALLWASAYFRGPEAARWRATGVGLLQAELDAQILADGMHYERSPSYHCQVFADLLECRHVLEGDRRLCSGIDAALHRMAQVTADLAHPDGGVALLNDAGLNMSYEPAECLDVYGRLFDRRPRRRQVFALESAGYYGLWTAESYLIVDCGRIAPDDLPAHGHGDVSSFEWSVAGERIIVDQGVFEYLAGERRRRSRAAESHNTLCFQGADQADFFGAFRCGRRPDVETLAWEPRTDGFVLEGTHDGFKHLTGAPRHVRRFEADRAGIVIHDRIEGQPDRPASIGFLLHPQAVIEVAGREAVIRREAGKIKIRMSSTLPIEVEDAVWWPDMGHEKQTHRLQVRLLPGVRAATTSFLIA